MTDLCKHGVSGYCDECVSEAEHNRCYERFFESKGKIPKEGVGFQP